MLFFLWIFSVDCLSQVFFQFPPFDLKTEGQNFSSKKKKKKKLVFPLQLLFSLSSISPSTSSLFLPFLTLTNSTKQVRRKALLSFPFSSPYFPSIKHGYGSFISLFGCLEGEKLGKMKERI